MPLAHACKTHGSHVRLSLCDLNEDLARLPPTSRRIPKREPRLDSFRRHKGNRVAPLNPHLAGARTLT